MPDTKTSDAIPVDPKPAAFQELLARESDFALRRAVERLREGLFDPLAVRLLTAHEDQLREAVDVGFRALDAGGDAHLSIVGAYGQGKSHSLTYIREYARKANFVTSFVNLDPREVPFHRFKEVYRALMDSLSFPDTDASFNRTWRAWVSREKAAGSVVSDDMDALVPDGMPHLFRCVLAAMARQTVVLTEKQRAMKKHARYRPRQFARFLSRVLSGERVPAYKLRTVFKYRQVGFYRDASLAVRGDAPYVQLVHGLARLFRQMGYRGWVVLFDEGEAVAQAPVSMRRKSYPFLHDLFYPSTPGSGLFPVFGFTDDFFRRVEDEDVHRTRMQGEEELPYFDRNYAEAWRDLTRYQLQDLTAEEWQDLSEKLIHLHARAYDWQPEPSEARPALQARLAESARHETRYRLKALVDELDLLYQDRVFA